MTRACGRPIWAAEVRAPGPQGLRPSIAAEACFGAWWEWFDLTDDPIPAGEENTI
jgi:hypothetical protein